MPRLMRKGLSYGYIEVDKAEYDIKFRVYVELISKLE